jgi:hypothetical protein
VGYFREKIAAPGSPTHHSVNFTLDHFGELQRLRIQPQDLEAYVYVAIRVGLCITC